MPKYTDISVDLETLSTRIDACIISIGAVAFCAGTGEISDSVKTYLEVDIDSATRQGHVSASTLKFWFGQPEAARRVFDGATEDKPKYALPTALHMLYNVFRSKEVEINARVWANGPADDLAWLAYHYQFSGVGMSPPWRYNMVRDMRTLLELAKIDDSTYDAIVGDPKYGSKHHALGDATRQAALISHAWQKLMGKDVPAAKPSSKSKPAQRQPVVAEEDDEL